MFGCNTHLLKHIKQAILAWSFRQNINLGCFPVFAAISARDEFIVAGAAAGAGAAAAAAGAGAAGAGATTADSGITTAAGEGAPTAAGAAAAAAGAGAGAACLDNNTAYWGNNIEPPGTEQTGTCA